LVAPRQRSLHCRRCHSGRASIRVFTEAEAEAELEAADRAGAHLVAMGETGYPPALTYVDAPPPLLYAKSRLELAAGPIVAMVGACNGSAVGRNSHAKLAAELGLESFVIASGLARGIDTHLAALERGTIAVLAGGLAIRRPGQSIQAGQPARRYTPQPLTVSYWIPLMGPFFPGPFLRAV